MWVWAYAYSGWKDNPDAYLICYISINILQHMGSNNDSLFKSGAFSRCMYAHADPIDSREVNTLRPDKHIRESKDYVYGIWVYKALGIWKCYYRVKQSLVSYMKLRTKARNNKYMKYYSKLTYQLSFWNVSRQVVYICHLSESSLVQKMICHFLDTKALAGPMLNSW